MKSIYKSAVQMEVFVDAEKGDVVFLTFDKEAKLFRNLERYTVNTLPKEQALEMCYGILEAFENI